MGEATIPWPELFAAHKRYLWSVCYRLTGDVQDAEDLVQSTFARAIERPPEDRSRPLRPWLTRVASNLAIDLLRRRKHRAYDGPWLPAPIEELEEIEGWTRDHHGGEVPELELRYGQLESARMAFLLALEALEPRARAVLILRDVIGYSGPEVAEFLGLSTANVRVILHRARRTLDDHRQSGSRDPLAPAHAERIRVTLERFMAAIVAGDADALAELLADEVRTASDGGGEFRAARKIVHGRDSVMVLLLGIARGAEAEWIEPRELNGEPALLVAVTSERERVAPRVAMRIELDQAGKIAQVQLLLARRALAGIELDRRR